MSSATAPTLQRRPAKQHIAHVRGEVLSCSRGLALGGALVAFGNALDLLDGLTRPVVVRSVGAAALAGAVTLRAAQQGRLAQFGLTRAGVVESLPSGLAVGLLLGSPGPLSVVWPMPMPLRHKPPPSKISPSQALLFALGHLLVGTAFAEEVLFRGLLQAELTAEMPAARAITLTGLCWTAWHIVVHGFTLKDTGVKVRSRQFAAGMIAQLVATFVASLFLGELRRRSRHLAGCMLAHWLLDLLLLGSPVVLRKGITTQGRRH